MYKRQHDQTEAMTLGTRIVVMKDGVVQQVDTPQTLYNLSLIHIWFVPEEMEKEQIAVQIKLL